MLVLLCHIMIECVKYRKVKVVVSHASRQIDEWFGMDCWHWGNVCSRVSQCAVGGVKGTGGACRCAIGGSKCTPAFTCAGGGVTGLEADR